MVLRNAPNPKFDIAPDIIQQLWRMCSENAPNEACGVLLSDNGVLFNRMVQLANYAPDPTQEFWMNPEELAFYQNQSRYPSMATWHTHPTSRWNLSPKDRHFMQLTQLPMAIVAVMPYPSVVLYELRPDGIVGWRYKVEAL